VVKNALPLALLVTCFGLVLNACGEGESGNEPTKPEPTTPEAATTAEFGPEEVPRGRRYTPKNFEPTLSFTNPSGGLQPWSVINDYSDTYEIRRFFYFRDKHKAKSGASTFGRPERIGFYVYIAFWQIREVFDASEPGKEIERPAPENMVAWLQKHSYLNTTSPKPATVGGVKGKQLDITVAKLPREWPRRDGKYFSATCDWGICVPLIVFKTGPRYGKPKGYGLAPGDKVRFIFIEGVEGKTVVVAIFTKAKQFDKFVTEAYEVLDTVKWEGA